MHVHAEVACAVIDLAARAAKSTRRIAVHVLAESAHVVVETARTALTVLVAFFLAADGELAAESVGAVAKPVCAARDRAVANPAHAVVQRLVVQQVQSDGARAALTEPVRLVFFLTANRELAVEFVHAAVAEPARLVAVAAARVPELAATDTSSST
ncbi:uncharacterized protein LOC106866318 [Brachypodium distachyon]|uniref:uncharacterized protein LOC106866318 n=1 Tax=Brachypodium distachyon TaxID=15368 RepID=UPI00071C8E65|nr:uncharacterized protein LOC106866318 [Brachypodium distachyon]|eukprot:XP_014755732.1 uncharacterized protein LOC106866318 [Brachypodium distachyon]